MRVGFGALNRHIRELSAKVAGLEAQLQLQEQRWTAVTGGKRIDTGEIVARASLHDLLMAHFSMGDLMQLAFDCYIDFDTLPGDEKGSKARSLIQAVERDNRTYMLIGECQKARPGVEWPSR